MLIIIRSFSNSGNRQMGYLTTLCCFFWQSLDSNIGRSDVTKDCFFAPRFFLGMRYKSCNDCFSVSREWINRCWTTIFDGHFPGIRNGSCDDYSFWFIFLSLGSGWLAEIDLVYLFVYAVAKLSFKFFFFS